MLATWAVPPGAQRAARVPPPPSATSVNARLLGVYSAGHRLLQGHTVPDISPIEGEQPGSIIGIVTDSLHDGPLAEATVTVTQLPRRSAMTTASGAFRIDSLPPGRYTLEVLHPVLDSLGIRLVSDTIVVAAGEVQTTVLSTPGPAGLVAVVCPPLKRRLGPAAILGQVLDADTDKPAVGAEVSLVWVETAVSRERGIRTDPRVRKATVGEDGTFRLCGLPNTLTATLQASLGAARTAEIGVETTAEPLVLRFLRLPLVPDTPAVTQAAGQASPADTAARSQPSQAGNAVVTGIVTNRGGVPVADARVTVQGGVSRAASRTDGSFALSGVPTGTQLVMVRRVGYEPVQLPIDITSRGPNRVTVRLGEYHEPLATVEVQAKRSPSALDSALVRTGFPHRQAVGFGHFVTEHDIEKMQPVYTSDVLRRIPGVHVLGSGHTASVLSSRGESCVNYLIDRNPANPDQGMSIDDLVNPADIVGIEFYQANDAPAELTTGPNAGCALLIVWTRGQLKPR